MNMKIEGIVTQGYRIASGLNTVGVMGPYGEMLKDSFVRQRPFFEAEIPELTAVWTGTINLTIAPRHCVMKKWDYEITCQWHPGVIETFGIVQDVTVYHNGRAYAPGFIYYPLPSEIHIPRNEIIEILAPKIEGLTYGDEIAIEVSDEKVAIEKAAP